MAQLRSLSPKFEKDEHEGYVQVLVGELEKSGDEAPLNIALTGHYGSGKSSVLTEITRRLRTSGHEVTNLSLPSLGIGNGRLPKDGEQVFNTTNLIQKEIVKQLLYRRPPAQMPASRYNRLDTFDEARARSNSRRVGVAAIVLGLLLSFPSRVASILPDSAWAWLDGKTLDHLSTALQWASFVPLYFAVTWLATATQRLLQQRLRITELGAGAGPAKLKLSESTSSYFDEYLDEIVYFFQTSQTTIVVFEDLDRFKNPQIFETLRELNLLLNNAAQTGDDPIRFVYAIRDSIFEQLDNELPEPDGVEDESDEVKTEPAKLHEVSKAEERRLITTNRTKFFDLVIPMVPFISHRTSRNLMRDELRSIPDKHRPSQEVVDLVGSYITDMRLIKNICNEYDMFRTRILRDDGLEGLKPDKLFASIVYKNLYLSDYERLRTGDSLLDDVYKAYRAWVAHRASVERTREVLKRAELRRLDSVTRRSKRLGERLQAVLAARVQPDYSQSRIQIQADGTPFGWDDLLGVDFWRTFLNAEEPLSINYDTNHFQPQAVSATLSFAKVETLIGESLDSADWAERDRSELKEEIADATAKQLTYAHASLRYALNASELDFTYREKKQTLEAHASGVFQDAEVVLGLLRAGYLDENFTLYVTQFPGDSSASAINFILKAVQRNEMDIDYHFGSDNAVDTDDIRAVLDSEGTRLLKGKSIYNKEIFDYLFSSNPALLTEPIRRLASGGEDALRFIDAYEAAGAFRLKFVTELSRSWDGVFEHLLEDDAESVDLDLLDAALLGANESRAYDLSDAHREIINSLLGKLKLSTSQLPLSKAKSVAAAVSKLGIRVAAIDEIATPLRTELIAQSAIALNRRNLQAVVGDGNPISLDVLKLPTHRPVYELVMNRLPDYIDRLDEEPAAATVTEPSKFVAVLEAVGAKDSSLVEGIAQRANDTCVVADLSELSAEHWPALASAQRVTPSASNVAAYLDECGLDAAMKVLLEGRKEIDPDGEHAERLKLALELLNSSELASELRVALAESLGLDNGSIAPASLTGAGQNLIPELLQLGLITDDEAAYEAVAGGEDNNLKQRVIISSKNFPSYMLERTFSAQELYIMMWTGSPEVLRVTIADNFDTFGPSFGQRGSAAFAKWAARVDRGLALDAIELLASKAGAPDAAAFVKLLGAHADDGDIEIIRRTLNLLGGEYAKLTTHGRDRPKVPIVPGIRALLERLRREGIVSKYSKELLSNDYRVSKRRG
ncbi:hypothetical protein QE370_003306 [Aeromicrobium sp. SORGH_AS981]|uniref:YobI family P-loop NTPase n=1 Tax=Aeromicrobium sp. SORGH_AS_0981 TaxID=3041802 RepID=UPI00285F544F|nr:hypothetical protein [Aeromicrobium sp. SORGH_AS_0981]MDR6120122.1 hypothetical protein [Aeromicrobium sp. SORGH_AS_0981]